ncbi:MAG: stationary phase inducible protein CsiE [Pantoea eucrina]|jgi:transcriptional antiterminator|uniref:stationary phase inducible protein CsiE n=1 Tax=Pantoea TaxID=53335 RepID=UPI00080F492E|nr:MULTISPECIES: stationary phase inducible protein CsiE [Pantoea]MDF2784996.1 stationary phase inducible protein CsiE [Pantoea eucrina]
MSFAPATAPLFSRSQRRCHLLLLLFLPAPALTLEKLCQLNGVDPAVARQDIADVGDEIQRFHQLELHQMVDGSFRIHGTELDRRLCLIHWLRRALRLSQAFVCDHFVPALRQRLKVLKIEKALWDEINLQALIQHCSLRLMRNFSPRDRLFLLIFMKYALCQRQAALFNERQRSWLSEKAERIAADDVIHHWQKRCHLMPDASETDFWTLLFSLIHAPDATQLSAPQARRLMSATEALIARFEQLAKTRIRNQHELKIQLYTHLAQALDRSHFSIGIDNSVALDVARLYPRLMRTTERALYHFSSDFGTQFSAEETSLVAVLFGAWMMQESALQEKQVLLLTGVDAALEQLLEQQLRDMTLLPINITYQDMLHFQREGAPRDVALVVTPYAISLPLFSPPLIHAELPLSDHQQQRILQLLEF